MKKLERTSFVSTLIAIVGFVLSALLVEASFLASCVCVGVFGVSGMVAKRCNDIIESQKID